ncbi:MAG: hypothetical protein K0S07_1709 [Chlamydiales bacterium]|nr:hypothetical protein [Chlamydiales bacterium]
MIKTSNKPMWRNGRRGRLKIYSWRQGAGSSPVIGKKKEVPFYRHFFYPLNNRLFAAMAELVDALDSGSSRGNSVDVRVILAAFSL